MADHLINGIKVRTLGDPHLGRAFVNGVPLHRRGDREAMQWQDFEKSFKGDFDVHVCMGDLFDRFVVPLSVILQAANAYVSASWRKPHTQFVVLRGNHDAARDSDKRSAFDVFAAIVKAHDKIMVVSEEARILRFTDDSWVGFFPWHPFKSAEQIVNELKEPNLAAAFGHWDIESFGQVNTNLIPYSALHGRTTKIFTGHIHLPQTFRYGPFEVVVTGSMQPYAHGEDPAGNLYITKTTDELQGYELDAFHDKCLRVVAKPGEVIPQFDCLQLTVKREGQADEDDMQVGFESFNVEDLLAEAFTENGVGDVVKEKVLSKLRESRLGA